VADIVTVVSVASQLGRALGGLLGGSGPSRTERLQMLVDAGSKYGTDSPQYKVLADRYSGVARKHASLLSKLPTAAQISAHGALPSTVISAPYTGIERVITQGAKTAAKVAGKLAGRLLGPISIGATIADSLLQPGPAYSELSEAKLKQLAREGDKRAMAELQKREKTKRDKEAAKRGKQPGKTPPGRGAQPEKAPVPPGNPSPASVLTTKAPSAALTFLQSFLGGLIQGIPQLLTQRDPGARVSVSIPASPFTAMQPQSVSSVTYLTGPSASGVTSPKSARDKCKCPPKKKGKPRQPRTECWGGTYVETATGLRKTKRRRVAC